MPVAGVWVLFTTQAYVVCSRTEIWHYMVKKKRQGNWGHSVKVFFSLTLMVVGAIATYFFATDIYGIFLYESEEGSQGITLVDWLYIFSPVVVSLAVIFVGWRLYRSIPRTNPAERSKTKSKTGLFLLLLGAAIAVSPVFAAFFRQLPYRNLFLDGPDANSLELWLLMFTLPIGGVIAIIGLVQRSDGKPRKMRAPIANPDQSADQVQAPNEDQAVDQAPSTTQIVLIVIAMFIGLNVCFGSISSFMNVSLHPSWGIFAVLQFLAGAALIYWGIRRLKKK